MGRRSCFDGINAAESGSSPPPNCVAPSPPPQSPPYKRRVYDPPHLLFARDPRRRVETLKYGWKMKSQEQPQWLFPMRPTAIASIAWAV
ncbi:hypothetical protein OPV22_007893 [Ensete ventricosum]|uniref:Uncharacterized protein n=1 Tax=Ensete ventricosum TaxID=4639 RepID=A0AAV8R5D8_ENSVE|nr:hypothetical protein OPV22_007893 [Ensete ventricosum]